MDKVGFYAFSFNNPSRKADLEGRFVKEGLEIEFVPNVEQDDNRLERAPKEHKRNWSIMWNHLDMLKAFIQSNNTHGVFCEDDLLLRKGLKSFLPELVAAFERRDLEILLLGYLTIKKPAGLTVHDSFSSHETNLIYLNYDDNIWGAHMYMLNRKTAEKFLKLYTVEYSQSTLLLQDTPFFSPDWTLTKMGSRALVYPMMGVEIGSVITQDIGQINFHKACFDTHYSADYYH